MNDGHCKLWMPALLGLALSLPGCSGKRAASSTLDAEFATAKGSLGPVTVDLQLRPAKARLSDTLQLEIAATFDPGVKVEKPAFDGKLGDFDVLSIREQLPATEAGKDVARWTVEIEPRNIGKQLAGPVGVRFTDSRKTGDGKQHTVQVEPIEVEITSSVDPNNVSLEPAKKLSGPIAVDPPPMSRWAIAGIAAFAVAVMVAMVYMIRYRRREDEEPGPSPADLAADEFAKLEREGWIDSDPKRFYVELTGIVRRYIERTTGISAPEQTTEEFLRECERNPIVPWTRRDRLRDFLEAADLVKFAAVTPLRPAMDDSLRMGRRLVDSEPAEVSSAKSGSSDRGAAA